jgi:hypothetical protein
MIRLKTSAPTDVSDTLSITCHSTITEAVLKSMGNKIMDLLGFKEEIVKGIHVDIARCRRCSQKARPLPIINI